MRLCEESQIVVGLVPYDMSLGAGSGDYISLKNYRHVAVVFLKDAGTASENATITLQQASDVAGTGVKSLNFTEYYLKDGTQTGVGTFTKTSQTAAATVTATGANEQLLVVEFDGDDLDVDNGFDCIRATISDAGSTTAAYGTLLYILSQARYPSEPALSAIAD